MPELKSPTTYSQQLEKLRPRGCQVSDIPLCEEILSRINYYRLSAYFLPFKKADGNYLPGTDFNTVYQICEFDRKLRNLLFAAIEEVEIYLRAKFAYYHAHKYGALGYMDAVNYNQRHRHDRFMGLIETEIKNSQKVLFVQHHIANYGGQFPVWAITELFTFGMLSYFYGDLPVPDQKCIAKDCLEPYPRTLSAGLDAAVICEISAPITGGYISGFLPLFRQIFPVLKKPLNAVCLAQYWPLKRCILTWINGTRKYIRGYAL